MVKDKDKDKDKVKDISSPCNPPQQQNSKQTASRRPFWLAVFSLPALDACPALPASQSPLEASQHPPPFPTRKGGFIGGIDTLNGRYIPGAILYVTRREQKEPEQNRKREK